MGFFSRFADRVMTVWRLGPANVAGVLLYRFLLRVGFFRVRLPMSEGHSDPLFSNTENRSAVAPNGVETDLTETDRLLDGEFKLFSRRRCELGSPPDWFGNPYSGGEIHDPTRHWSLIDDFSEGAGDIKCVWEISRFDWALTLAQAYVVTTDQRYLGALIDWSADWTSKNPANSGPNWKCGQEASVRMMQLLLTAHILGEDRKPLPGLVRFVEAHCERIQPTYFYAKGQDNNHGTSEAAALFIGGAWLQSVAEEGSKGYRKGARWQGLGRRWLEERVARLIEPDGSFAQYSVNYHRMLIDTLAMAEFWRGKLDLSVFSNRFYGRAKAALDWLWQMVDGPSGGAPNIGNNDGARLFNLTSCAYGDFRPTLQFGHALFHGERLLGSGPWDDYSKWLGVDPETLPAAKGDKISRSFSDGGFVVMRPPGERVNGSFAVVRSPNFRFRPSHADALHLDLWVDGVNVLRDAGTYSYNAPAPWQTYFPGTAAHNTVEFDGRDQMPRLGRFLFGSWLPRQDVTDIELDEENCRWQGGYRDRWQANHRRKVVTDGCSWTVTDKFSGHKDKAILRWHLAPGDWRLIDGECVGEMATIQVAAEPGVRRMELVPGWESRFYLDKNEVPVLEIEFAPGKIVATTEIRLS